MERFLTCKRCRMEFPASDLRISPAGGWICRGCLAGKAPTDRSPEVKGLDAGVRKREAKPSDAVSFTCSCGFVVQQPPGKKVTRCPYCGRDANAFTRRASAQDILDGADGAD